MNGDKTSRASKAQQVARKATLPPKTVVVLKEPRPTSWRQADRTCNLDAQDSCQRMRVARLSWSTVCPTPRAVATVSHSASQTFLLEGHLSCSLNVVLVSVQAQWIAVIFKVQVLVICLPKKTMSSSCYYVATGTYEFFIYGTFS